MLKKVQIHILPTDKDAAFFTNKKFPEIFQVGDNTVDNPKWQGQHLYFTSNEEIKDHEPSINIEHNTLIIRTERGYGRLNLRKIVATTNPELWYSSERTERGKFENLSREEGIHKANFKPTSISRIPLDFIKKYVEQEGNIKEVELEYGNITNTRNHTEKYQVEFLKLRSDGTVIIHPNEDVVTKSLKALDEFIKQHPEEAVRIGKEVKAMGFEGPTVSEYFDMTAVSDILDYMCKGRYYETNPVLYQYVADFLMSDKRKKLEKIYTREEVYNIVANVFVSFNDEQFNEIKMRNEYGMEKGNAFRIWFDKNYPKIK